MSAVVLAPLLIAAVVIGGPLFVLVVLGASVLGTVELYALLNRAGYFPLWSAGLAVSIAFTLDASLSPGRLAPPVLALALVLSLAYLLFQPVERRSLTNWAVTWVAPLYVGFLLSHAVSLRAMPSGELLVLLALGVTWATDVAAYLVGMAIGRRPFFASISPRKTREGAVGGILVGVIFGVTLVWGFGWDVLRFLPALLVLPVAAEAGDLAESMIKRELRAKDSSNLIPGHGGILDRTDSVLFVVALLYYWVVWIGIG